MTSKISDLSHSLYEYFKYDPLATKNIQKGYIKFFKDGTKVLDIACGRGEFLELLSENGIHGTGIEMDQKIVENLKTRGFDCVCDDIFHYLNTSKENSFDGIFTSHFIEHLEPEKVVELLEMSCKILKPDGILVITTPNVGSLPMHLDYFHRDFTHIKFYHPKIIEFFLEQSGFKVMESGANENFWFRSPISILPIDNQKTIEYIAEPAIKTLRYINLNDEFNKISYTRTINPFIFLQRKVSGLMTKYVLNPQFNEISKIINNQISDINKIINNQISDINKIINNQISDINKINAIQNEKIEKQVKSIIEIAKWADCLHPPSEVYVAARKK
ncbi:MAG: class I SAM-dependent methyltransferase [Candidatus Methanoperedenaceae archaeon]|nr:class I SAM-dependent methyltransferase [Candidatus Methanoperedenaceae archaeon]